MNSSGQTRSRFFYGYIIVGAAFFIQVVVWGTFNSYSVLFNALLAEFGWTYAAISGAASLGQFIEGVGAVFMGRLNDRFGPRPLMIFCAVTVGLGYFLMRYISRPWQLYLFQGIIIGLGISCTDVVLLSTIARWFNRRRGTMSGIVKIGTGVGTMILPLILTMLIGTWGWRNAYTVIGVSIFIIVLVASLFLRRDPASMGLMPDGAPLMDTSHVFQVETGFTLREAIKTRSFWMLCLTFFASFFCTFSMIVHFVPVAVSLGMSATFAAGMVSLIGGASIAGRFFMGVMNDRIGSHRALLYILMALVAAYVWLQFAGSNWSLIMFAVIYGFCDGGFYTLMSLLVAEFFGMRSHGLIFGIMVFSGSVGGAIGSLIIGRVYDMTGTYEVPFLLLLAVAVIGAFAIFTTGKPTPPEQPSGL